MEENIKKINCKTCKFWNTRDGELGECIRLLDCWEIKFISEVTTDYGKYGEFTVEHPVIEIDTDKSFCCSLWEKGEYGNE